MNDYLSTLGLCLRAGKLTAGIDAVSDCIAASGDVRLSLLSADAGETIARLGASSADIGAALGRASCAVCCIQEIGFAAGILGKAAQEDPALEPMVRQLKEKSVRIASRRGKKKARKGTAGEGNSRKANQSTRKKRGGERP